MILICNYRQTSIDRPVVHTFFRHIIFESYKRTKIEAYYEKVWTFLSEYPLLFYSRWFGKKLFVKKSGYPWSIYRGFTILKLCAGVGLIINYANLKLLLQKVDAHLPPLPPNDTKSKYEFCLLHHILLFQMQY